MSLNIIESAELTAAKELLQSLYHTFNNRDIDSTLRGMQADVRWPNGMEGGIEHGHEAVRQYWTRQWTMINPRVEPVEFSEEDDGRVKVHVHQVVKDLSGNLLADQMVYHIYTFKNGLVTDMEIRDAGGNMSG